MFDNSYLKTYFKIHEAEKKRLEQTQVEWVDSVKSIEEEQQLAKDDENQFNLKTSFWKKMLSAITFTDNYQGDDD